MNYPYENCFLFCREMDTNQRKKELLSEIDRTVDDLYYLKDILCVGKSRLSAVVTQNVLDLLVFPILLPLFQLRQNNVRFFSSEFLCIIILNLINNFWVCLKLCY